MRDNSATSRWRRRNPRGVRGVRERLFPRPRGRGPIEASLVNVPTLKRSEISAATWPRPH